MDGNNVQSDQVIIGELTKMGFEFSVVMEAIKAVGPSLDDAVEFILKVLLRTVGGHQVVLNVLLTLEKLWVKEL